MDYFVYPPPPDEHILKLPTMPTLPFEASCHYDFSEAHVQSKPVLFCFVLDMEIMAEMLWSFKASFYDESSTEEKNRSEFKRYLM